MSWPTQNDPSNADATPVLDGWGWGAYWSADEWLTWHAAMKAKYGLDYANRTFLTAWNDQGFGASPLNARSFNSAFRDYAKANGFFQGLYGDMSFLQPLGVLTDIGDAASGAGSGIKATGTVLKWVLPIAVVGVIGIYLAPYLAPRARKALAAIKGKA